MWYIKDIIRDCESIKKFVDYYNLDKEHEIFPNLKKKASGKPKIETL